MYGLNNFKSADSYNNFISFDITKVNYGLIDLINGFSVFTEFMDRFHVSAKWIEEQFNDPRMDVNDLFDYTVMKTDFLVEKEGVYTERTECKGGIWSTVRTYYDVYVGASQFTSITLNILAEKAMRAHFPAMFEAPFTKKVKLDPNILNLSMETKAQKWMQSNYEYRNYTFGDIFKLINDVKEGVTEEEKSMFTIYADGWVFLKINDDYSAHFNTSDFFNKDWNAVLNKHLFSIPQEHPTKNNKWYDGKQGDYFAFKNSDIVKKVKERFFK